MKTLIRSQAGSLNAFVGFLFPLKILFYNIKKGDDLKAEGFLLLFIRIVISMLFFFFFFCFLSRKGKSLLLCADVFIEQAVFLSLGQF